MTIGRNGEREVLDTTTGHRLRSGAGARAAELAAVDALLDQAANLHGECCLIAGEPGMGKTFIAGELVERARFRGIEALVARCWETVDAPPYWPWIQVIRQARRLHPEGSDGEKEAARLLTLIGDADESSGSAEAALTSPRIRLFDAISTFLSTTCEQAPLAVVIEDLHAADESSLLLMRFLASEASTFLLAATFDEVAARSRPGYGERLAEIGRARRVIGLNPLSEDEVRAMYADLSGSDPSDPMATAVYQASEGNPLFVEEAVRMLATPGGLHRPDHSRGFRVPEGAKGIIRRRLESLPDKSHRLLAVAAVIGRRFDLSTLQTVTGDELEDVLDALDHALRSGLIAETSALGLYSFTHLLLRETLYEDLGAADRMRLHHQVAETLEDSYGSNGRRIAELAHHWFKAAQAGDPKKTMQYTMKAAEQAMELQAYEEALRLYRRALQVADVAGIDRDKREAILAAIATATAAAGAATSPAMDPTPAGNVFKREGEYWTIVFGGMTTRLKDSKGMRHLAELLKNPGTEMHVLELAVGPGKTAGSVESLEERGSEGLGDAGAVLDAAAKASYKRRLTDLSEELEEATAFNDPERAARAQEEIDAIVDQLAAGMGLGGRDRKMASQSERARVSVTKTIKEALRRIGEANRLLGDHLRSAVRTGTYCTYEPDPRVPITWET